MKLFNWLFKSNDEVIRKKESKYKNKQKSLVTEKETIDEYLIEWLDNYYPTYKNGMWFKFVPDLKCEKHNKLSVYIKREYRERIGCYDTFQCDLWLFKDKGLVKMNYLYDTLYDNYDGTPIIHKKYKIFKLNEDSLIENIFKTAYNWSEDSINKLNNVIIKKTDNKYVCDISPWCPNQVLIYRSYKYNK